MNKGCLLLFFSIISFSIVYKQVNAQSISLPKIKPIILPVPTAPPENESTDLPAPVIPQNQILNVSIDKTEFSYNEKVVVKTILDNQSSQTLIGKIVLTIHPLDTSFPAKVFNYEFDLLPGKTTETFISEMMLEDWMIEGKYEVNAQAKDQYGNVFASKSFLFDVVGGEETDQDIEADADVCANEDCSEKKMIFTKDEIVYLKLNSKIDSLKISATLKTPNGIIEILNFVENMSSYSLKNNEPGKYSIWINLSGDGYKNRRIEKEFIFEEGYTEEVFESVCKIDGKCEGREDSYNCPKDCLVENGVEEENKFYSNIFVGIIIFISILGAAIFIIRKKSAKYNTQ